MHNSTNPNTPDNPADVPGRMYGLPLDHPLDREPDARRIEAAEMFRVALAHVGVLGAWDRTITAWLAGKDGGIIATVASLLRRAWQAGLQVGRDEGAADSEADRVALSSAMTHLAARLDALTADVRQVMADLTTAAEEVRPWAAGDPISSRLLATVEQAVTDLTAVVGDDLPAGPVRSVVLPPEVARRLCDFLEVDGHRVQWAHRDDMSIDVRLSPTDVVVLQSGEWDADAVITAGWQLSVGGGADRYEVTVGWPRRPDDDDAQVDQVRGYGAEDQDVDTAEHDAGLQPVLQPGTEIPGMPGFVVGVCGHRIAGSEWRAGFRTCERCPADEGHSTPLVAAGLASGVLGVTGLVATHSGSPGAGLVLAAVGGVIGVVVLVLGRRGRDGGAS